MGRPADDSSTATSVAVTWGGAPPTEEADGAPTEEKYAEAKVRHRCKFTHSRAYSDLFVKNCSEGLRRGGQGGGNGAQRGGSGGSKRGGKRDTKAREGTRMAHEGAPLAPPDEGPLPVRALRAPWPAQAPDVVLVHPAPQDMQHAARSLLAGPGSDLSPRRCAAAQQPSQSSAIARARRIDASRCDPLIWSWPPVS